MAHVTPTAAPGPPAGAPSPPSPRAVDPLSPRLRAVALSSPTGAPAARRVSRRAFLAALAAPLVLPAGAGAAERDQAVLNFALLLENLQMTLYEEALELGVGFDLAGLIQTFAEQEEEHVRRLRDLGAAAESPLRFTFGLETRDEFLRLAPTVEDTVVGAYVGAAPAARTPEVRTLLASILHTEAQQASTLRRLADEVAAPAAFEEVLSRTVLLDRVRPVIAT